VTRRAACPCGAVRFTIDGPIRDVIVCHCDACQLATGGPWPASAAYRRDLSVETDAALIWEQAAVSEYGASRGRCRDCGTVVFWDAPERETVSFGAALLPEPTEIAVAAHIWVSADQRAALGSIGVPVEAEGLPASVSVGWEDEDRTSG
jgi:hypothetical protein